MSSDHQAHVGNKSRQPVREDRDSRFYRLPTKPRLVYHTELLVRCVSIRPVVNHGETYQSQYTAQTEKRKSGILRVSVESGLLVAVAVGAVQVIGVFEFNEIPNVLVRQGGLLLTECQNV